jgi:glucosamine-phosphate N-acetyltransferase
MTIQKLTPELLIQYKKSYFETLSALVLSTPLPDSECHRVLENMYKQNSMILVVVDENDSCITWTCTICVQQKLSKWGVLAAQIEEIAVHPSCQWKWVWSKLLNAALEYSRKQWCYKAILNCEEHNAWWYEKFGFEKKEVEMKMYL